MSSIAAIHAMKRELGLEEDDYRAMLMRLTGVASLRAMDGKQLGRVVEDMKAKGAGGKKRLSGPYGGKLQALWISAWNLGIIRNPSNEALLAFVKGQTGIDHTRFLRNFADARKAIEALKSWMVREAGVAWTAHEDPQDCVLDAQLRLLKLTIEDVAYTGKAASEPIAKLALMQLLGDRIRSQKAGA